MPFIPGRWLLFVAAAGVMLTSSPAGAQSADALFDTSTLHDVHLFINSRELALLRKNYDLNTVYPADLQWRDVRVRNVGVRSRGRFTRNPVKLGLQIEVAYYASRQRFLGLQTLVLDNLWQDPSLVREHLAMGLFRRAGVAAPRVSFARLFINRAFQGVYGIVEGVDASFLEREFADASGYLFEFHSQAEPFLAGDLGTAPAAYKPLFEARTRQREADTTLYTPIRDLFREINQENDLVWRERIDRLLDVDALLRHLAVESFVAEADGLTGVFIGMNNFYLYRPAETVRHRLIPWDRDASFIDLNWSITPNFDTNQLFRRLMAWSDLRERYLEILEACARLASEDDWLMTEIDRSVTLVRAAAHADRWKRDSNEAFEEAALFLREFARVRLAEVVRQIEALRARERQ